VEDTGEKELAHLVLSGYFGILPLCFILWAFWSLSECEALAFLKKIFSLI